MQSMPVSSGAMVPTGWIPSAFQCVDLSPRNLGARPIISDMPSSQLHAPVGFSATHADYGVPQGREDRSLDGPAEAAPTICPLCQAGGNQTPGPQDDANTDSTGDSSSEQQTQTQTQKKPLQRRKRTMSRKRSW